MPDIRSMTSADWPDVARIYGEGIGTGNATFETELPEWEPWDTGHLGPCRLVAEFDGEVVGFAALSPVSSRFVYRGVAETSIYVGEAARGTGVGNALMGRFVAATENAGFWTLQAAMFPENAASVSLHQRHGFRVVGRRDRIGQLDGVWRDVLLMERRSSTIGTE